jgi:hypothetical protein
MCRWKDDMKMYLQEVGGHGTDLSGSEEHVSSALNAVMSLRVP